MFTRKAGVKLNSKSAYVPIALLVAFTAFSGLYPGNTCAPPPLAELSAPPNLVETSP